MLDMIRYLRMKNMEMYVIISVLRVALSAL